MTRSENNDMFDRLNGDEPVERSAEAAHRVELPSDFAELIADLMDDTPIQLYRGNIEKKIIRPSESE